MKIFTLLFLFAFAALQVAAQTNLVVNGDFEQFGNGWTLRDPDDSSYFVQFKPYSGLVAAEFGPEEHIGKLSQTLNTVVGQQYILRYFLLSGGITTENGANFSAYINNKYIVQSRVSVLEKNVYEEFAFIFTAKSQQSVLKFEFINPPDYWYLDRVSVIAYNDNSTLATQAPFVPYVPVVGNFIKNGGFEAGLAGWTILNDGEDLSRISGLNPHSGYSALQGGPDTPTQVTQTVSLQQGNIYQVTFYLSEDADGDEGDNYFRVLVDGVNIIGPDVRIACIPTQRYSRFFYQFTATRRNTVIIFDYQNPEGYYTLDDVSVTLVSLA